MSLLCKITGTPAGATVCPDTADGINATDIWIGNKADVTLADPVDGTITTAPTMAASTNLYKLEILEDDGDIKSTLVQGARGSNTFTQEFSGQIISINEDARDFLTEALNGRFVLFVRTKAGEILVGGSEDGMKFVDGTEMGVAEDTFGISLVMQSLKCRRVTPGLLVTDEATTVTTLDGLV